MEEKDLMYEAEIEIQQDTDYDELLKKFEEPTENKKPKKNHKALGIVISLVAVVLLTGTFLFMLFLPGAEDESTIVEEALLTTKTDSNKLWQAQAETTENGKIKENGTGTLLNYIPEKIKNIKVENSLGSYSVNSYTPKETTGETNPETGDEAEATSTTEYTIVGFEDFDLETGAPDDLANDCASLEFSKIISTDATDNLKDYGLDNPRAVTTITYTDGSKAIVKVGNDALQGAGTYISFGDSNAVYIVSTDAVDTMLLGINDLFSLTINKSASDTENANFESVQLTGTAYGEKIVFIPNEDTDSIINTYLLTTPKEIFADETEASSVAGGIRGLMASKVICVNPTANDIKKYGLSSEYAHIVAKYPDITVDLIASQPDKDGNCYIMENKGKIIYSISSSTIPWVSTDLESLTSDYVLNPKLQGLAKMTVKSDTTVDFILNTKTTQTTDEEGKPTDSTTTTVYHGTQEITIGNFETYFGNIALLTIANSQTTKPTGKADLAITYSYSGSRDSDTVEFFKTSDDKHIVSVNSSVIGQVYSSYVDKIKEQTSQISENKQVTNLW